MSLMPHRYRERYGDFKLISVQKAMPTSPAPEVVATIDVSCLMGQPWLTAAQASGPEDEEDDTTLNSEWEKYRRLEQEDQGLVETVSPDKYTGNLTDTESDWDEINPKGRESWKDTGRQGNGEGSASRYFAITNAPSTGFVWPSETSLWCHARTCSLIRGILSSRAR